ncbi:MAG: glycosyltransferase family 4 protein [Chthonomonadales bacterium]
MRILMLSWEYPPKIVGGIARHVEEIAWALAANGDEVHVVTCDFPGAPNEEVYNGVHIHRVAPYSPAHDFFHWVHQLNAAMYDRAALLLEDWTKGKTKPRKFKADKGIIIHSHDWLAYFAGVGLKNRFKLPFIGTIHATEYGRNNGIHTDIQKYINSIEMQLCHESWRVIACSDFMKLEVEHALQTPWDKIDVIPNGVHAEKFDFKFSGQEAADFRAQFAAPHEKLIFFVGRMVREKGVNFLIEAMPGVLRQYPNAKLIIVGGGNKDHLIGLAHHLGVIDNVYFTGFISDDNLLRLYKVIDVAAFPSLYEPFGIVALEAMAAGVPVVVSDAGGLREIIDHDHSGTVTWAGNVDSLTWGLVRALKDEGHTRWMAENAKRRVHHLFNWDRIAKMTSEVYQRVWKEFQSTEWE